MYKQIFCSREVHECIVDKESPTASASLEQALDLERFPSLTKHDHRHYINLTLSPNCIITS